MAAKYMKWEGTARMKGVMKKEVRGEMNEACSGSITVFLTILFLLFFSLVGVAFENARILSAAGYMRVAAHSAAMTVFGAYNRELYRDYGLFAYGGCNGKEAEDLAEEFTDILIENVRSIPENAKMSYGNLYRFQIIEGKVAAAGYLTDSEIFREQIKAFLKSAAVKDLTGEIQSKVSNISKEEGIDEKLALTKEYEEGGFDVSKKQGGGEKLPRKKEALKQDEAKENPLEIFTDMMRDGVLNLVCNVKELSDGIVEASDEDALSSENNWSQKRKDRMGAADYLKGLLEEDEMEEDMSAGTTDLEANSKRKEEIIQDKNILQKGAEKINYTCYANQQFGSYVESKNRTTKYGLEYLIAGKKEEKENLACVVNKLLRIRLLLNFGCIVTDKVLQEKSLVTATILAGFTGLPPVIRAVQYTILLILAFEESCIDVAALLKGKSIPVVKSSENLKIKYEEICLASKELFESKAQEYSKGKKASLSDITYQQYLWIFLLEQSEENLRKRSFDLIQYDLREKYNQSFCIRTCICQSLYCVRYQLPFLFAKLPFLDRLDGVQRKGNMRELEVDYAYKSS